MMKNTSERLNPEYIHDITEWVSLQIHRFPYHFVAEYFAKDLSILEVGCGTGYGAKELTDNGFSLDCIDVDKDVVDNANKLYGGERLRFHHYDGQNIDFDDNTFDLVISFQVIEHVKSDISYLREIHRVLKAGGQVLLTTPNREYRLGEGESPWNTFHVTEYDKETLDELISKVFDVREVMGIKGKKDVSFIEIERMKSINDIGQRLDRTIGSQAWRVFSRILYRINRKNLKWLYKPSDCYFTKEIGRYDLHLAALCRKEA